MADPEGEILILEEVATYLKAGKRTVYRLAHERKIPTFKLGGGWRFCRAPRIFSLDIAKTYVEHMARQVASFIFFAEQGGKVVVDLVEPHGLHLADALPKLQGLATYANEHADVFRRIEAVAEASGKLRVLYLTSTDVRQEVLDALIAKGLFEGQLATDYV